MLRPGSLVARVAAVGLLAILLLAGDRLVVEPVLQHYQASREQIVQAEALLQRYRALAAERPLLAERLAAFEAAKEPVTGYLEGPSDALAAAELQDLAAGAIEDAGGEIRSAQILPAEAVDQGPPVRRAGLRLRFAATIEGLAASLHDLETTEPLLVVDQLIVAPQQSRRPQTPADEGRELDIRLDLVGYLRAAE